MKADDVVVVFSHVTGSLKVNMLDNDGDEYPMVLIEGNREALRFFSQIVLAVAEDNKSDGFFLSPNGAGSAFFSPEAKLGFYVHCTE